MDDLVLLRKRLFINDTFINFVKILLLTFKVERNHSGL